MERSSLQQNYRPSSDEERIYPIEEVQALLPSVSKKGLEQKLQDWGVGSKTISLSQAREMLLHAAEPEVVDAVLEEYNQRKYRTSKESFTKRMYQKYFTPRKKSLDKKFNFQPEVNKPTSTFDRMYEDAKAGIRISAVALATPFAVITVGKKINSKFYRDKPGESVLSKAVLYLSCSGSLIYILTNEEIYKNPKYFLIPVATNLLSGLREWYLYAKKRADFAQQ